MPDHEESLPTPALPQEAAQPRKSGLLSFLREVFETVILALILFAAINFLTARNRVEGSSMEPTLRNGEFVLVNRLAYRIGQPQRGDVIVFHYPKNPTQEYIKRVIGLPGDVVKIFRRQVSVNGKILNEPYIADAPNYMVNTTVPADTFFVLGDNRNNSSDSHSWGPVPLENVVGKALLVYWPPDEWGTIDHNLTEVAYP
jgi:signal peptidase I